MAAKVTIGADPESFLYNTATKRIIPACGLVGGTKSHPLRISKNLSPGFTIQEDNVLVEYNIPPCRSTDQWINAISTVLGAVKEYLEQRGPYKLVHESEHAFPNSMMEVDGAMQFGCSPDFNAYNNGLEFEKYHHKEFYDGNKQWRFAGGHIHIGYDAPEIPHFVVAAFADLIIGLRAVGSDQQKRRRAFYGQPGRYRPTPWGIEYRTPSNFWLHDGDETYAIGTNAFYLGHFLHSRSTQEVRSIYSKVPWAAVRNAIIENNDALASQIEHYLISAGIHLSGEDDL